MNTTYSLDKDDSRNVILEIRAGTGGKEAELFVSDLLNMYEKFAIQNGWNFVIMDSSSMKGGGYRQATINIVGNNAFQKFKFESGVHRVQRVPRTETGGRIHSSTVTVAVLPEASTVDVKINDNDIRIDTFRSSGPGGQHANKTDSAVRITHIPSGIVVSQEDEKVQFRNKSKAMKILLSRLYEAERERLHNERLDMRNTQIGSGKRSEKIRTYNFAKGRVTDHRIKLTLQNINKIMSGELDKIINKLTNI